MNAPLPSSPRWFYLVNRQKLGPVTFPELSDLVSMGRLKGSDMILQEGSTRWQAAGSVAGLFSGAKATAEKRFWLREGGPYTAGALRDLGRIGEIGPGTEVRVDGEANWMPAKQVPEIAGALGQSSTQQAFVGLSLPARWWLVGGGVAAVLALGFLITTAVVIRSLTTGAGTSHDRAAKATQPDAIPHQDKSAPAPTTPPATPETSKTPDPKKSPEPSKTPDPKEDVSVPDVSLLAKLPSHALAGTKGIPRAAVAVLEKKDRRATALGCSPNGKWLAAGFDRGDVSLWDFQSFREKSLTPSHQGQVTALAISPNGRLLATVGQDRWLKLWDVARVQPTLLDKQEADEFQVDAVAFHPDSGALVTGGADRRIRFWKVSDQKLSNSVLLRTEAPVYCLAFDPKGKFLVSAGRDKAVRLWDPTGKNAEPLAVWTEHSDYVISVACSPSGNLIATAGRDRSIILWPLTGTECRQPRRLTQDADEATLLAFSPDGKQLAAAGRDGQVAIWNVVAGFFDRKLTKTWSVTAPLCAMSSAPDGGHAAIGDGAGHVLILRLDAASDDPAVSPVVQEPKDRAPAGFSEREWNQIVAWAKFDNNYKPSWVAELAPALRTAKAVFKEEGIENPSPKQLFNFLEAFTGGAWRMGQPPEKTNKLLMDLVSVAKSTGQRVATKKTLEQLEHTSQPLP